ncbi:RNA chaperone Hfq [Brevibacillus sp. NRS-1366]|uniref:RNA chaperone Hfq n=1 Tax=Brevibacillus sp. NRS-1366 TaxID=3233899 RepID=UPI003D1DB693
MRLCISYGKISIKSDDREKGMFAMVKAIVQEGYLNYLVSNEIPVTLITKNGVPMNGIITHSDSFTILIETQRKQSLLYKAAISTIVPSKPVPLSTMFDQVTTNNK